MAARTSWDDRRAPVTYVQSTVLGAVQGLTEFLPVSSSGHLILVPVLLGWPDQGLAFDAAIHLGTLAALLVYFRADLRALLAGRNVRLLLLLMVGTVPAGLAGLAFGQTIESRLRDPRLVAVSLIAWAVVMWLADRHAARNRRPIRGVDRVDWVRGLTTGLAQAVALIPGTSRSGITITAGLLAGMDRVTAARFAFLLSIPVTAAAGAAQALSLLRRGLDPVLVGPLAVGVIASFLAGLAAVWFLVGFLGRGSLLPFVIYRIALGVLILALFA
jgi:undecaprenyl-diphosphatase